MTSRKIAFIPSSTEVKELVPHPKPAKLYVPKSYKQLKNGALKNPVFEDYRIKNVSIKQCMPFLDSLTSGYIQETWTDIYIERGDDGHCIYQWASAPEIMSHRNEVNREINDSFYPAEYVWRQPWRIKTEKNYSCLIVHPLNREDLPFYTLSGIIDSDKYQHITFGNLPFYIKKDFQGLIPAGTPMFQIIPFKREHWISTSLEYDEKDQRLLNNEMFKHFSGAYKNKFWQSKKFD